MKRAFFTGLACALLAGCATTPNVANTVATLKEMLAATEMPVLPKDRLLVCMESPTGKLMAFDPLTCASQENPAPVWQWDPMTAPEIADAHRGWYRAVTDCKEVDGGKALLTTASGGAVTLLRRADKKVLFYAKAGGNPHSAEMLPDGNIVTASSTGNRLSLFTILPETPSGANVPRIAYTNTFVHGVVWDARHKCLWALGLNEVTRYTYNFDKRNPALTRGESVPLPPKGHEGHDLIRLEGTPYLLMTGEKLVSLFDTDTLAIHPLAEIDDVKSLAPTGLGPRDGILAMIPTESWWGDRIVVLNASRTPALRLKGARFYKARFLAR